MASGQRLALFRPVECDPVATSAAPDTRNGHPVLDFSGQVDQEAVFTDKLTGYAGGGFQVLTAWALSCATTGPFRIQAALERMAGSGYNVSVDTFGALASAAAAAPAVSGETIEVSVALPAGALLNGDGFRLKIRRDADQTSGPDTIATDAELLMVELKEA